MSLRASQALRFAHERPPSDGRRARAVAAGLLLRARLDLAGRRERRPCGADVSRTRHRQRRRHLHRDGADGVRASLSRGAPRRPLRRTRGPYNLAFSGGQAIGAVVATFATLAGPGYPLAMSAARSRHSPCCRTSCARKVPSRGSARRSEARRATEPRTATVDSLGRAAHRERRGPVRWRCRVGFVFRRFVERASQHGVQPVKLAIVALARGANRRLREIVP